MDSFISWIGGKKLLRKAIIERFPSQYDRYIEVFGGAGWVLFGKPTTKFEVFNDIDSNLINLYRCVRYHCDELQRELEWLVQSREQFNNAKRQLADDIGLTDIQRAARYYLLIKASFGSSRDSFGTSPKPLAKGIEYLPKVQERLKRVVIEHKSYEELIKVYDRPNTLFYVDPPYVGTEGYYNSSFGDTDHHRLAEVLHGIKGKFVLSYNDDPLIRELYKDCNIEPVVRNHNLSSKQRHYEELIITNY